MIDAKAQGKSNNQRLFITAFIIFNHRNKAMKFADLFSGVFNEDRTKSIDLLNPNIHLTKN